MLYFKWLFIDFRSVCVIFVIFINATLQQVKNECSFCKKLINSKFLLVFEMMTKEKTIRIEMCIVEMHAYLQNTKEHITHDKDTNIHIFLEEKTQKNQNRKDRIRRNREIPVPGLFIELNHISHIEGHQSQ